jgi:hypothetical protein
VDRFRPLLIVAVVPLFAACSRSPSVCVAPYEALPFATAFVAAMVFGLFSAAAPKSALTIGAVFMLGVCVYETYMNVSLGCGMPACRSLLGYVMGTGIAWFAAAAYGYALSNSAPWAKLGGGALAGALGAAFGMNFAVHTC